MNSTTQRIQDEDHLSSSNHRMSHQHTTNNQLPNPNPQPPILNTSHGINIITHNIRGINQL
ncbi:662_t:CDS:1, partial [Gigaspora rosea]